VSVASSAGSALVCLWWERVLAVKKAAPLELKAAKLVALSDLSADSRVAAKAASSAVC
jgi:hypothetical protein